MRHYPFGNQPGRVQYAGTFHGAGRRLACPRPGDRGARRKSSIYEFLESSNPQSVCSFARTPRELRPGKGAQTSQPAVSLVRCPRDEEHGSGTQHVQPVSVVGWILAKRSSSKSHLNQSQEILALS